MNNKKHLTEDEFASEWESVHELARSENKSIVLMVFINQSNEVDYRIFVSSKKHKETVFSMSEAILIYNELE